jgi:hypothetical protein
MYIALSQKCLRHPILETQTSENNWFVHQDDIEKQRRNAKELQPTWLLNRRISNRIKPVEFKNILAVENP